MNPFLTPLDQTAQMQ